MIMSDCLEGKTLLFLSFTFLQVREGQMEGSIFRFVQDLFFLDGPVQINRAPLARTVTEGVTVFPHFITGTPGKFIRGTVFLFLAIENIPAGSQNHQVAETGQGESPVMDQAVDLVDLGYVKGGVEAVIGILFP
jgi:hypothetical protein